MTSRATADAKRNKRYFNVANETAFYSVVSYEEGMER
jgi:hypothetical protein